MKITTFEIFIHYMRYNRTVKTILLLEKLVIAFFELEKVVIKKLPQGGFLGLSSFIDTGNVAAFHAVHLWLSRSYGSGRFLHFS